MVMPHVSGIAPSAGKPLEDRMERVAAYIDGFNLYYGMKDAFGRKYLWLDVEALCQLRAATRRSRW